MPGRSRVLRAARAALALAAAPLLAMPGAPAAAQAARYRIAEDGSQLYVQVFKDEGTIASGQAHDHVIRATRWSGTVRFDPEEPRACELRLRVPVEGLAVDEAFMRDRVGYDKDIDADARREVRGSMLDEGQLDAESHPTITLSARDCRPVGDDRYRPTVTVTVRGEAARARPTLSVSERDGGGLRVEGRFTMRHEDFGIEPYSAFLGAVANAQPIRFVADLALTPASE